jgi:hypothetical protein
MIVCPFSIGQSLYGMSFFDLAVSDYPFSIFKLVIKFLN